MKILTIAIKKQLQNLVYLLKITFTHIVAQSILVSHAIVLWSRLTQV